MLDTTKQHKLFLRLIAPMVFVTDIGFIFMGKVFPCNSTWPFTYASTIIVQKESYAAILFVLSMNQFFLSFLVPVVIELSSESKFIKECRHL